MKCGDMVSLPRQKPLNTSTTSTTSSTSSINSTTSASPYRGLDKSFASEGFGIGKRRPPQRFF
jgi:hypothetical protein